MTSGACPTPRRTHPPDPATGGARYLQGCRFAATGDNDVTIPVDARSPALWCLRPHERCHSRLHRTRGSPTFAGDICTRRARGPAGSWEGSSVRVRQRALLDSARGTLGRDDDRSGGRGGPGRRRVSIQAAGFVSWAALLTTRVTQKRLWFREAGCRLGRYVDSRRWKKDR
jgi:hypothetical protein